MRHSLLVAWISGACLLVQPPLLRAHSVAHGSPTVLSGAGLPSSERITSPDWWRQRKKRFHALALCALASANVTYTLLVGFSGFGAAIGFTAALLGVIICL